MNLSKIIKKIQYPRNSATGKRYYVDVNTLFDEIKKEKQKIKNGN